MSDHGTRQAYSKGCRCAECKAAQAGYMRGYKARKAGADIPTRKPGRPRKDATVTALPTALATAPLVAGEHERAVLEELATLTSAETRKAAATAAVAMARLLDNPLALAQQPQAAARLTTIMEDLRKGASRRKGRLASVQSMTREATG
jgi:hypothetical protein